MWCWPVVGLDSVTGAVAADAGRTLPAGVVGGHDDPKRIADVDSLRGVRRGGGPADRRPAAGIALPLVLVAGRRAGPGARPGDELSADPRTAGDGGGGDVDRAGWGAVDRTDGIGDLLGRAGGVGRGHVDPQQPAGVPGLDHIGRRVGTADIGPAATRVLVLPAEAEGRGRVAGPGAGFGGQRRTDGRSAGGGGRFQVAGGDTSRGPEACAPSAALEGRGCGDRHQSGDGLPRVQAGRPRRSGAIGGHRAGDERRTEQMLLRDAPAVVGSIGGVLTTTAVDVGVERVRDAVGVLVDGELSLMLSQRQHVPSLGRGREEAHRAGAARLATHPLQLALQVGVEVEGAIVDEVGVRGVQCRRHLRADDGGQQSLSLRVAHLRQIPKRLRSQPVQLGHVGLHPRRADRPEMLACPDRLQPKHERGHALRRPADDGPVGLPKLSGSTSRVPSRGLLCAGARCRHLRPGGGAHRWSGRLGGRGRRQRTEEAEGQDGGGRDSHGASGAGVQRGRGHRSPRGGPRLPRGHPGSTTLGSAERARPALPVRHSCGDAAAKLLRSAEQPSHPVARARSRSPRPDPGCDPRQRRPPARLG